MRTTITRSQLKQVTVAAVSAFLTAAPVLAEIPQKVPTPTQQNNVRRLVLINECMGCDLAGVDLTGAHLIGSDLRDANLQFANLTGVNLEGADLEGADLTGANLTGAFLTDTCLADTQLIGVNFTSAHIYSVDVTGATMENLTLVNAEIFNTPISVGGEDMPLENGQPAEPTILFEDAIPPGAPYDYPPIHPER